MTIVAVTGSGGAQASAIAVALNTLIAPKRFVINFMFTLFGVRSISTVLG